MTHINAYIQAVEIKRQALLVAQGEFDQAVLELQAKKAEANPVEAPEPEPLPEPEQPKARKEVKYK